MISGLRRLQARFHFELVVVDVDGDPELERQHGAKVPVLMHGERELCHYGLDTVSVTAYLSNIR
jgi:thioredoxin reductase (NADPH)